MNKEIKNEFKISAIMPNYNMSEFLSGSLQSLVDQTKSFYEIIVVDDGSEDESIAVIEKMALQYPIIRLIRHEKNQGVNPALNTGIAEATGDYILLCGADDTYGSKLVEKSQAILEKYPTVGLICGDAVVERFDLAKPFYRMLPFPVNQFMAPAALSAFANKGYVGFNGGGGMVLNRQAVLAAQRLKTEARWHSDWLLYCVIAFRCGIYYVNEVFVHIAMRQHSFSAGTNRRVVQDQVMLEILRMMNQNYSDVYPYFRRAGLLPHYALRYILLFLLNPIGRRFMTPLLLWKCFINNTWIVHLGRHLFPYRMILMMRKFLRA